VVVFLTWDTNSDTEQYAMRMVKYVVCRLVQQFEMLAITTEEAERQRGYVSWQDAIRYHVGLTMDSDIGNWVRIGLSKADTT
jgi:hypothetical protein